VLSSLFIFESITFYFYLLVHFTFHNLSLISTVITVINLTNIVIIVVGVPVVLVEIIYLIFNLIEAG